MKRTIILLGAVLGLSLPVSSHAYTEIMPDLSFQAGLAYGLDIQQPGLQLGLVYKFPFHERWRFGVDGIFFRKGSNQSGFTREETTLRTLSLNTHYLFAKTDSWNIYLMGGGNLIRGKTSIVTRTPLPPILTAAVDAEGQPFVVETPQEGFDEITGRRDRRRLHVNVGLGLEYKIQYWGEIYLENVYVIGEYDQLITSLGVRYTW